MKTNDKKAHKDELALFIDDVAKRIAEGNPELAAIDREKNGNAKMDYPESISAAAFFKAFSDSTRIRIMYALTLRELCVSELCALLELSQPTVSNHLRILSSHKIVKFRRSGKNTFYSIDDWHVNGIIGMAMEHLGYSGYVGGSV